MVSISGIPWLRSTRQADIDKQESQERLLIASAAESAPDGPIVDDGHDSRSQQSCQPTVEPLPAGKRRMSWFAWMLLTAAVRSLPNAHACKPNLMNAEPHATCLSMRLTVALLMTTLQLTVKSSAGAVFASMPEVGAITVAAWRMQLASVIMLPVAVWQYHRAASGVQDGGTHRQHRRPSAPAAPI